MFSTEPTPYDFVPLAHEANEKERPIGHSQFDPEKMHGYLSLSLNAKTAVHVSTGILSLGSNINLESAIVQPMSEGAVGLIIPGSSLKGAIRSIYEAITKSPLGIAGKKLNLRKNDPLNGEQNKRSLSPAGRVFGAMGYQGLLRFSDAICDREPEIGFMPVLFSPGNKGKTHYFDENSRPAGRKFYYHTQSLASRSDFSGTDIQQAPAGSIFTTKIQFKNLSSAELGTLLISLGQAVSTGSKSGCDFPLKIGAGKPMGFGTIEVNISEVKLHQAHERYSRFDASTNIPEDLHIWKHDLMHAAHETLIVKEQLDKLREIWAYPTNRQPPKGNY